MHVKTILTPERTKVFDTRFLRIGAEELYYLRGFYFCEISATFLGLGNYTSIKYCKLTPKKRRKNAG